MKKEVIKEVRFLHYILILLFSISFIFAAHVITTSSGGNSYSVEEDIGFVYNLSVNNTDTTFLANISQVNITIPDTFSFLADSNGTNAATHTFTNTSTILSWDSDGLVMNLTWKYFWFNATALTPGSYNLTIMTTNVTGTETTNISVTINDTTSPDSIVFVSPTELDNSNLSRLNIVVNVTATDNGVIDTFIVRLFNSTSDQINSSSSSNFSVFINFTGLSDGVYYFNATINDTYGNANSTTTRTVTLDTSNPAITLISPIDGASSTTSAYNFTFNVTDDQEVANCSLIFDGSVINILISVNNTGGTNGMYNSSLSVAGHTWSVNCTDITGNTGNSSTRSLTVTEEITSGGGSSGGYPLFKPSEEELREGYEETMYRNWRTFFKVEEESHILEVESITDLTTTIIISSEPQEITLSVGEEKQIELSGDNYYDLSIKLNSIKVSIYAKSSISLTVKLIHQLIEQEQQEQQDESQEELFLEEKGSLTWLWVLIVIIVLIWVSFHFKLLKKKS